MDKTTDLFILPKKSVYKNYDLIILSLMMHVYLFS